MHITNSNRCKNYNMTLLCIVKYYLMTGKSFYQHSSRYDLLFNTDISKSITYVPITYPNVMKVVYDFYTLMKNDYVKSHIDIMNRHYYEGDYDPDVMILSNPKGTARKLSFLALWVAYSMLEDMRFK